MSTQGTWFPGPPRAPSGAQQLGSADETSKWQAEMIGIHSAPLCCTTGSGSFLYQRLLLMADLQAKISSDELAGKCPWTQSYPSKTGNLHPLFKCWGRGWHSWWTGGGQTQWTVGFTCSHGAFLSRGQAGPSSHLGTAEDTSGNKKASHP